MPSFYFGGTKVSKGLQLISREVEDLVLAKLWGEWGNGLSYSFLLCRAGDSKPFDDVNTQIVYFKSTSTHLREKATNSEEQFL